MSKSLANFFTVADIAKEYDPMVIRWYLISSHYRSSNNYTPESMEPAKKTYNRLLNTIKKVNDIEFTDTKTTQLDNLIEKIGDAKTKIINAMDDDFDTPVALAELLTLFREINKALLQNNMKINREFKDKFYKMINFSESIFGIFPFLKTSSKPFSTENESEKDNLIKNLINLIIEIRAKLREKKIYDVSDIIRDRLRELSVDIEDKKVK
jgi:cysteinyl-tRNA synthetase